MNTTRVGPGGPRIAAYLAFTVLGCNHGGEPADDESSSSGAESTSSTEPPPSDDSSSESGPPEPACTTPCADEPEVTWQTVWGGLAWESAFGVAVEGQGKIVVTGPVDWPPVGGFVQVYDSEGTQLLAMNTPEAGYDVVWDGLDSFVFVGNSPTQEGKLRRYRVDGTLISESAPADVDATAYVIRALPEGGFVTGGGTATDGVLEYFDAAGVAIGSVTTPVDIAVNDLALTANGVLFVGEDVSGNYVAGAFDDARMLKWSDQAPALRALSIAGLTDGTVVGSFRDAQNQGSLRFYNPDGSVRTTLPLVWPGALVTALLPVANDQFIAAISVESPTLHCQLARYDSSGTQYWGVTFESIGDDNECVDLAPGLDDTLVIAGSRRGPDGDGDAWLLRIAR
ncbi:MAG TPA: hypothetical protein VG755_35320 [Nannocystaceae bacterium]|nr:hypothetical protein [Nannocystaceae bacterium]